MTFLPVAERELRVASRRRNTFWTRIAAALIALVIGSIIFAIQSWTPFATAGTGMGRAMFSALTWLCFAGVLTAGLFFTSDCLSEEKREGTIGFLFLTDLGGHDVVLGKLLASSLRSFYAVFAVFPILGITLLMGGVTGTQFWLVQCALVSAMFFSLAAGLFVSSVSRDPQKAMFATLALLVLLLGAGPLVDQALRRSTLLSFTSPVFLFIQASNGSASGFWKALLANQGVAWLFLGAACVLLPRLWQQTGARREFRVRTPRSRNTRLLESNPVIWLVHRDRWLSVALWLAAGLMAGLALAQAFTSNMGIRYALNYGTNLLLLALYLVVASQAARFFVDMRRSGVLEMISVTPLRFDEVVQGHWAALMKVLRWPLVVCLVMQLVSTAILQHMMLRQMAAVTTTITAGGGTNAPVTTAQTAAVKARAAQSRAIVAGVSAVTSTLTIFANVLALCWFGMWMGLTSKSTNIATLKTIAFVQIAPWFVIAFVSTFLLMAFSMSQAFTSGRVGASWFQWYPVLQSVFTAVLAIVKDVIFIVVARKRILARMAARNW